MIRSDAAAAPGEALQGGAEVRIRLRLGEAIQIPRGGFRNAERRPLQRRPGVGRWRPHQDAKLARRLRRSGLVGRGREQIGPAIAQLGGERLVLDEQAEFMGGMTDDMAMARERLGQERTHAALDALELPGACDDGAEAVCVAAARSPFGEELPGARGPVRTTIQ